MTLIRHSVLVEIARKWLLNTKRCGVVVTEMASFAEEQPDAIGWYNSLSILVECKASKSDFNADLRKNSRIGGIGVGAERYYLTVKGLLNPEEVPDGWGLLEFDGGLVHVVKPPLLGWWKEWDKERELHILLSVIKRIGQTTPVGVSCKCYYKTSQNKATISIDID